MIWFCNGYSYLVLDWKDIFGLICGTWCDLSNVLKMDELKNANFSFNKKSYVDALLQKWWVKEHAEEGWNHDVDSNAQKHIGRR